VQDITRVRVRDMTRVRVRVRERALTDNQVFCCCILKCHEKFLIKVCICLYLGINMRIKVNLHLDQLIYYSS